MRKILYVLATVLAIAGGACVAQYQQHRPHVITFSGGGIVTEFIEEYDALRRSGRRVVLDSLCLSACTLVVGLIPPERLCTTPYGQLGFHSAYYQTMMGVQHSSEGTRILWQIYPENLRQILRDRGWDGAAAPTGNEHSDLIYVEGPDLLKVIRAC